MIILFLGGWSAPDFLSFLPFEIVYFFKYLLVLTPFMVIRSTLCRYRYDLLMRLGWKVYVPLSLCFIIVILVFYISLFYIPFVIMNYFWPFVIFSFCVIEQVLDPNIAATFIIISYSTSFVFWPLMLGYAFLYFLFCFVYYFIFFYCFSLIFTFFTFFYYYFCCLVFFFYIYNSDDFFLALLFYEAWPFSLNCFIFLFMDYCFLYFIGFIADCILMCIFPNVFLDLVLTILCTTYYTTYTFFFNIFIYFVPFLSISVKDFLFYLEPSVLVAFIFWVFEISESFSIFYLVFLICFSLPVFFFITSVIRVTQFFSVIFELFFKHIPGSK